MSSVHQFYFLKLVPKLSSHTIHYKPGLRKTKDFDQWSLKLRFPCQLKLEPSVDSRKNNTGGLLLQKLQAQFYISSQTVCLKKEEEEKGKIIRNKKRRKNLEQLHTDHWYAPKYFSLLMWIFSLRRYSNPPCEAPSIKCVIYRQRINFFLF